MIYKNSSLLLDELEIQKDQNSSDFEPDLKLHVKSKCIEPSEAYHECLLKEEVVLVGGRFTVSF